MERYFLISCHALLTSAFVALILTGRLDGPAILIFTIGLVISAYRTLKGLPALLSARGAFVLSCFYIVFFLFDGILVSGSFISATIHLVLFLELAKLYQRKTDRDYLYLIILSFLQILAASSLTIDMSFVAILFLYMVALISTLMSFDMYRHVRRSATRPHRIARPLSSMSVWATLWIIVTAALLFLLIPRAGTGYFSRAASPSLLLAGFTDSVHLGDIGQVKLSSAVVMRARQISGPRSAGVKWRGIALDVFDGNNWRKSGRVRNLIPRLPDGQFSIRPVDGSGDRLHYEVLLEPLGTAALFGPHQIRAVSGGLPPLETDVDESVYMRSPSARRIQYRVLSEVPGRRRLVSVPQGQEIRPPEIGPQYLQLPSDLDPRIPELAAAITEEGGSAFEKASLVEAHLKRTYRYSLNLTWSPGPQPVATFLFDAKNGHCEYFASAMAILLRTAGIPTRMVNGFLAGDYNPVGNNYTVRQSDAHSWVEVYIPGRGWTEFDPTPPDPNQREINLAAQLWHYLDAAQLLWNSFILTYDSGTQMQLFRSAHERAQSAQNSMRDKAGEWIQRIESSSDRLASRIHAWVETVWFWPVAALVALSVGAFRHRGEVRIRFRIWRLHRRGGMADEDVVEQIFYRAARTVERRFEKRRPGQTWREWILGLPDPQRRFILTKALNVFEKSKYGQGCVSGEEFELLEQTVRELRGGTS